MVLSRTRALPSLIGRLRIHGTRHQTLVGWALKLSRGEPNDDLFFSVGDMMPYKAEIKREDKILFLG